METATPGKFTNFQKKIFPVVEHLTSKPEYANHAFTKKWTMLKRTPNTPMTLDISWRNIKILLGIKDMFQYRDMLVQCPDFTHFVKIQNRKTTRSGFDFGILHHVNTDLAHPVPTPSSPSGADDLSYGFEVDFPPDFDVQTITDTQSIEGKDNATEDKQQAQVTNDITTTPRQTNVSGIHDIAAAEDTDGSITSDGMVDISDPTKDVAWVAAEVTSNLSALQRKLQHMAFKFDTCMQQYHSRLAEADDHIKDCEVKITEQLNQATSKFTTSAMKHYHSITAYATTTLEKFQLNLHEYTEKIMTVQRTKITDMHTAHQLKIQQDLREAERTFNEHVEQAIERAIQEILSTADDATDNINEQAEHILQQATGSPSQANSWRYDEPKPSKLFPNVDIAQFSSVPKAWANAASKLHNWEHEHEYNEDQPDNATQFPLIGQFPHPNLDSPPNFDLTQNLQSLPLVNHNDMLKRVHLPYLCREQSYIWYLQIKSNANQYGIYLIGTEEFNRNKSLCPTTVHGLKINISRYNEMKGTLYHFLAQRTIIGAEHTDLRNTINRHAVSTDGYHVLYEIMQRIHPTLDPDVLFTAPQCSDYSDIHEYYTYLTSFLMHEGFVGRHYNPREQVNHSLRGLDQLYYPAIKRIRNQMDDWKPSDPNVPDTLILANLPNNVEKYMEEDGNQAIVRRVGKGKPHRSTDNARSAPKLDDNHRQYVDVKCPLYQTYGHPLQRCDLMALWLHLKDGIKLVDDYLETMLILMLNVS
jgi:hypothetical protein